MADTSWIRSSDTVWASGVTCCVVNGRRHGKEGKWLAIGVRGQDNHGHRHFVGVCLSADVAWRIHRFLKEQARKRNGLYEGSDRAVLEDGRDPDG